MAAARQRTRDLTHPRGNPEPFPFKGFNRFQVIHCSHSSCKPESALRPHRMIPAQGHAYIATNSTSVAQIMFHHDLVVLQYQSA